MSEKYFDPENVLEGGEEAKDFIHKQTEALSLNPEEEKQKEELMNELDNLREQLQIAESKDMPFSASGGEEEIGNKMAAVQKEELPKIYKDIVFESTHLRYHNVQKRQTTCQFASASNIMKALGIKKITNERDVAGVLGKSGEGNIWPDEISDLFKKHGLEIKKLNSTLEAIDALVNGSKIILHLLPPKFPRPHSIIISGIKIDRGNIEFYVNDPSHKGHAEIVSLEFVVDHIIPYSFKNLIPNYAISIKDKNNIDKKE